MSKQSITLDNLRTKEYAQAFASQWQAHMRNGGQSESGAQRIAAREQIYDSLRPAFPLESICVDTFRKEMGKSRTSGKTKWGEVVLSDKGRIGKTIVSQIANQNKGKKRGPKPKVEAAPPKDDWQQRYRQCVETGWVPCDSLCAIIIGVSDDLVRSARFSLEKEFDFKVTKDCAWRVEPKPLTPEERIKAAIEKIGAADKQTIAELLEGLIK